MAEPASINIMTNYLENKLLNHILRNTTFSDLPANLYLALYTSSPGETGGGTELSGNGYSRILLPDFDVAGSNASNSVEIAFDIATGEWGIVEYIGIIDALTSGTTLFYGNLNNQILISTGQTFKIAAGGLVISLSGDENGGWGEGIASSVLDFLLNGGDFSSPGLNVYLALGRAVVTSANYNLTSWLEVGTTDYNRKQITGWTSPTTGCVVNSGEIIFTENATVNWGSITNVAIFNNSNSGEALFWGLLTTPRTIRVGDGFSFPANKIGVNLDNPLYHSTTPPPVEPES